MTEETGRPEWRYPPTVRQDVVEVRHGVPVADPYRWLEDPHSDHTRRWVAAQQELTERYLATLPGRSWFAEALAGLVRRPSAGTPDRQGGVYLRRRNDGRREQDQLYVAADLPTLLTGGRLLLDPAEFDPHGRVSLHGVAVSPDGEWLAYGLNEAGSDWTEWRVRSVASGTDTGDRVTRSKFCQVEWLPDASGFFYWGYPEQSGASGDDPAALGAGRLLLHRLGTDQADDEVASHRPEAPRERASAEVTEDGRWLVLTYMEGTARRNRVAVRRIGPRGRLGPLLMVVDEPRAHYVPAGSDGDLLYLRTDDGAPRYRLLAVDLAALEAGRDGPTGPAWRELVAERREVLSRVHRAGDGFVAVYLDDASHRVYRLAPDGRVRDEVKLSGPLTVLTVSARAADDEVFLGTTTFVEELRAYRLDAGTGDVEPLPPPDSVPTGFTTPPVLVERARAVSRDGTAVPYFLVRRADLPANRPRPTILYGYGGFNQAITPTFRAAWPAWLAAGGVLVVANLRGGGEFGRQWYEAGTRERKQNVFDDFIAVAEHLVDTGVTTRSRLALHGRSNGGLLVGAVTTQRPDLAAVALPMVGVLDMLRFDQFTIGWAWVSDYGDPRVPADFHVLRAYSPLHRVRPGTSYPATLVLTGDHDDRVVPAHSRKFAAALQHAQAGPAPVLLRVEAATGHGVGKPRGRVAAETADLLAFAAEHTGLDPAVDGSAG